MKINKEYYAGECRLCGEIIFKVNEGLFHICQDQQLTLKYVIRAIADSIIVERSTSGDTGASS
jgi:hypothetical protein